MSILGLSSVPTGTEKSAATVPREPAAPPPVAPLVTDAQLEALAELVTRRVVAAITPLVTDTVRAQAAQAVADEVPATVRDIATTLVREEIARIRERRP